MIAFQWGGAGGLLESHDVILQKLEYSSFPRNAFLHPRYLFLKTEVQLAFYMYLFQRINTILIISMLFNRISVHWKN